MASSEVRRVDAGWAVEVGDGCFDAFLNDEVRWVAQRLYSTTLSLSPEEVESKVRRGDDDYPEDDDDVDVPELVKEGDPHDERLRTASIVDLSINLVQFASRITNQTSSVGYEKHTFVFEDRDMAVKAMTFDRQRQASSADVMRCLSRHMHKPMCDTAEFLFKGFPHQSRRRFVGHHARIEDDELRKLTKIDTKNGVRSIHEQIERDDHLLRIKTEETERIFNDTLDPRNLDPNNPDTMVTMLWVFLRDRRAAAELTLVHYHWKRHPHDRGVLQHRMHPRVVLRWVPMAMVGGVVELSTAPDEWPWWIDRRLRIVLDATPMACQLLPEWDHNKRKWQHDDPPPANNPDVATLATRVQKPQLRVLERWERSSRARGVRACRLIASRAVEDGGHSLGSGLVVVRHEAGEAMRSRMHPIFLENFGESYAEQVHLSAVRDPRICAFEVRDVASQASVAAVTLVLFDCVLADGTESVALLIDTFAVKKDMHSRGLGGLTFHDFCRCFAERHCAAQSYLIFAQCVRRGEAGHFWCDKLDPTSEARDVMLQAFHLGHVGVQLETQCEARARTFARTTSEE